MTVDEVKGAETEMLWAVKDKQIKKWMSNVKAIRSYSEYITRKQISKDVTLKLLDLICTP